MALKQIVPIEITLIGDGSSTVFTYALANLYQNGQGNSIPFGTAGVVPSGISIPNPPVAVTSSAVDTNGNITITLTTALGSLVQATFEVDLQYNSGAASSSSVVQTSNVNITNADVAVNHAQVNGSTVVTAATGVQKVGNVGNAGAIFDQAPGSAAPANAVQVGGTDGTNTRAMSMTAKGTQGAFATTTQDLKDAGRQYLTFTATAAAGVIAETMFSLSQNLAGTVTGAVTSYVIPNGKTLRIQAATVSVRAGAAAVPFSRVTLRSLTSGATIATSPVVFQFPEVFGIAATIGVGGQVSVDIPDGLEIVGNGTITMGLSHLDQATTNVINVTLCGYLY